MVQKWFSNIVLNVNPWPVHVAANEVISIDGGIDIMQTVEVGSQLKLDLSLQTALGNLPIPCLPIEDLNIGSCTYPVEHGVCDLLMPEGQACELPLVAGSYAPGDQAL